MATAIQLPSQMEQETGAIQRQIQSLKVTDAETFSLAADLGKQIKQRIKVVKEFFAPMKRKADEVKRAILDAEAGALSPLEQAETYLSEQAGKYRRELDRIARQAREQAEEIERARIAELRKAEAAKAREDGKDRLAAAIEAAPIDKPREVTLPPSMEVPIVRGTRTKVTWQFEIEDASLIPREYLTADLKAIGEFARTNKEKAIGKIPGVRIYPDDKFHFF